MATPSIDSISLTTTKLAANETVGKIVAGNGGSCRSSARRLFPTPASGGDGGGPYRRCSLLAAYRVCVNDAFSSSVASCSLGGRGDVMMVPGSGKLSLAVAPSSRCERRAIVIENRWSLKGCWGRAGIFGVGVASGSCCGGCLYVGCALPWNDGAVL